MPLRQARELREGDVVGLHVRGLVVSARPASDGERITVRIALGAREIELVCKPEFPFEIVGEPASPSRNDSFMTTAKGLVRAWKAPPR